MKNITVKEFIERLSKEDPDAIVCRMIDDEEVFYSSIEMMRSDKNAKYIDDSGDEKEGSVIGIY